MILIKCKFSSINSFAFALCCSLNGPLKSSPFSVVSSALVEVVNASLAE